MLQTRAVLKKEKKKVSEMAVLQQDDVYLIWSTMVGGDWRLVAVGGGWWRLVAVGGWRLVAVGGWWRLAVGGWWSLGAVLSKKKKEGGGS